MQLGATYKDKITGFQGVAVAHARYLSGCNQTLVVPPLDEKGAYRDSQWFDDQRLDQVGTKVVMLDNGATPGFDKAAPKR